MKFTFAFIVALILQLSKALDCNLTDSEVYPLSYQNVDRNGTSLYLNSISYGNGDLWLLGQTSLYNETFTQYSNNIAQVMFIARLNSTTGEVKWAKAFHVNESSTTFLNYEMYISEAQVVWFIYYENMTRFIPRVDQDGNILQIIWSGAYNLNSIDLMSFLEILTETDFILTQIAWQAINGISVSPSSSWDVSVLKMTTTPKVEYNFMIDFNSTLDVVFHMHAINNTWYIMWISMLRFVAFSYFPIDKTLIDINLVKNTTLFMQYPNFYEASQFYGDYYIWTDETSPMYLLI